MPRRTACSSRTSVSVLRVMALRGMVGLQVGLGGLGGIGLQRVHLRLWQGSHAWDGMIELPFVFRLGQVGVTACHMYASCMPHVCLMYASCMPHVCFIYTSCMPHMYRTCTSYVPHMYRTCTSYVPHMYLICTSYVPHMYRI